MIIKKNLETQLNKLYDREFKGAQKRSGGKWISEGEKNAK